MSAADLPHIRHPKMTEYDYVNMVAVVNGQATPEQAKAAMDWVMGEACGVRYLPLVTAGEDAGRRATDIALGRALVAEFIRELMRPETLKRIKRHETQR